MKCAVIFVTVLASVSAQFDQYGQARYSTPSSLINRVSNEQAANTLSYVNEIYPDGSYRYGFNTDNGIAAQAQGTPKAFPGNPPVAPVVSQGSFSWVSPEGVPVDITYEADENGYRPQGNAIPTSPPIPDVILRSIEYNLRNAPPTKQ